MLSMNIQYKECQHQCAAAGLQLLPIPFKVYGAEVISFKIIQLYEES